MKNFSKEKFNAAFFGLGNMGAPMAINLHQKGVNVKAYDLVSELVDKVSKEGLSGCYDIESTLENADIIISMLPHDLAVESLYLGTKEQEGILAKCAKRNHPFFFIDSSTISPKCVRKISHVAKEFNHIMIDAPVSGGVGGAKAGTLTFICGGENREIEILTPVLKLMGQNIFHAGPTGSGQIAKLLNNTMLAISMIGTSELLNFGTELGLDPQILSEIMKKSSGNNWVLEKYNPYPNVMPSVPSSHDYAGGFGSKLMLKDLMLGQQMITDLNSAGSNSLGKIAYQIYQRHCERGEKIASLDFSSVIQSLKNGINN